MKMGKLTVLVIVMVSNVLCLASTGKQPHDANSLTNSEDYLRYAALNNAALKAGFERWRSAVEQVPQAEALPVH